MTSFRKLMRDSIEERRALTRRYTPAGRGFMFCERHRERYPDTQACPVCLPGQKALPRRRYRR